MPLLTRPDHQYRGVPRKIRSFEELICLGRFGVFDGLASRDVAVSWLCSLFGSSHRCPPRSSRDETTGRINLFLLLIDGRQDAVLLSKCGREVAEVAVSDLVGRMADLHALVDEVPGLLHAFLTDKAVNGGSVVGFE